MPVRDVKRVDKASTVVIGLKPTQTLNNLKQPQTSELTSSHISSSDFLLVEVVEEGDGQASAPGGRFVLGRIDHPMKRRAPSVVGPSSHQVAQIDDEIIFLRDCKVEVRSKIAS